MKLTSVMRVDRGLKAGIENQHQIKNFLLKILYVQINLEIVLKD